MDLLNLGIFTFTLLTVSPSVGSEYSEAIKTTRIVLLKTKYVKNKVKVAKKVVKKYIPLEDKHWTALMVGGTIASGTISTKPFKKFRYGNRELYVRPDIDYNWKEDKLNSNVNFHWEF